MKIDTATYPDDSRQRVAGLILLLLFMLSVTGISAAPSALFGPAKTDGAHSIAPSQRDGYGCDGEAVGSARTGLAAAGFDTLPYSSELPPHQIPPHTPEIDDVDKVAHQRMVPAEQQAILSPGRSLRSRVRIPNTASRRVDVSLCQLASVILLN